MQRALLIRDRTFNQNDIVLDTEQFNQLLAKGWRVVSHCPLTPANQSGKTPDAPGPSGALVILEKPDDELDEEERKEPCLEPIGTQDQDQLEALARELGKELGGGLGKELEA